MNFEFVFLWCDQGKQSLLQSPFFTSILSSISVHPLFYSHPPLLFSSFLFPIILFFYSHLSIHPFPSFLLFPFILSSIISAQIMWQFLITCVQIFIYIQISNLSMYFNLFSDNKINTESLQSHFKSFNCRCIRNKENIMTLTNLTTPIINPGVTRISDDNATDVGSFYEWLGCLHCDVDW